MNTTDFLRSALSSLRANILRSVLTTLGIMIGVGAVIVMVAVGSGAQSQVDQLIRSLGSNLLIVVPGSANLAGVRQGAGTRSTLTWDDALAIEAQVESVAIAAPSVRGNGQLVAGNANWATAIEGITPGYLPARNWTVARGRGIEDADVATAEKSALLGNTVAANLFPGEDAVGQALRIENVPFTVVGVLAAKGQSGQGRDQDDLVYIPLSTAKTRVLGGRQGGGRTVASITVQARTAELVPVAQAEITELLRQRHSIREGRENDFDLRNISEAMSARAESSRVMSILLAAVASVSLVVGGIGIMNIMLVSVTERTREIGLRLALGARGRDILIQFLLESLALSSLGGLIGVALGIGGSNLVADMAEWPMLLELSSVAMSFGFAAAVGIFFGYYPAHKAARLDPIEALRYD